jgi:hypothetical protein
VKALNEALKCHENSRKKAELEIHFTAPESVDNGYADTFEVQKGFLSWLFPTLIVVANCKTERKFQLSSIRSKHNF